MKRHIGTILKIVFSALLIGYLFTTKVDLAEVLQNFKGILWPWLLLGASLHLTGLLFSAFRWQILLKAQNIHQPIRRLVAYYMVGHFFNMFLPTKVGGDVVRIYDTSKDHGSTAQPLAVILVERISGMLTMLLLAAIVVAMKIDIGFDIYSRIPGLTPALILFFIAIAAIPLFFLPPVERLIFSLLAKIPVLNKLHSVTSKIYQAFKIYGGKRSHLAQALAMGFLLQINYFMHYYLLARALGIQTPLSFFFVIIPIRTVTLMIPFFINGIGLREFFDVKAFQLIGTPATAAVAFAELAWLVQIAFALFGGIVYITRHRKTVPKP